MLSLICLLAFQVVAVKVFKKQSPNGKLTVYLGKRDFVDRLDGVVDPIDGIVVVDNDYLKNRYIFGQVATTFRFGREEDEVMGVKFSKEMVLCKEMIVPPPSGKRNKSLTPLQEKLISKLGSSENVYPFVFQLPDSAPPSVTLAPGGDGAIDKPLGVEYEMKALIADSESDPGHRRSTVSLRIRKVQYAGLDRGKKQPSTLVSKAFTFSPGKINLEVTLDRDIYYHGEDITANIQITNNSKKSVKGIKAMIMQHCEVTMVNAQFAKQVAHMESREGCPITPGASLSKKFTLNPSAKNNKDKRGIALDGHLRDEDVNLASSTMSASNLAGDQLGFVISYSLRVNLNLGTLGGELRADLPFKLVHPGPGADDGKSGGGGGGGGNGYGKTTERARYEKQCYAKDEEDENIVFEDFAKLRMSMSEIEK